MQLTLSLLQSQALKRYSNRPAVTVDGATLSYRDLDEQSDQLAAGLQALGVEAGDRVALFLTNDAKYVIADLAILKTGTVKVPLNKYQSADDVCFILSQTHTRVLIADGGLLAAFDIPAVPPTLEHIVLTSIASGHEFEAQQHTWDNILKPSAPAAVHISGDDVAMITYTGGTTGKPKGVVQEQHSLAINLAAHIVSGEITASDTMLLTTPLPHSAGYHLQACLLQGGSIVLQDSFSAETFFDAVEHYKVTWTFLVPTMIYRLLDHANIATNDLTSLKTIVYGAAPMSTARLADALDKFGPHLIQLYGQTECPNYITALTKEEHLNPTLRESCGKAVPFAQVQIAAGQGEKYGEVVARAPYLLREYYGNPDATKEALREGWLYTGDIGYIDESGYLFLKDRAKDMVISGGMNVYTIEVEQTLKEHPAVVDAAVVGLPHPDWGEAVHAVVVPRQPIDEEALTEYCRRHLSKYKVPKSLALADALPLTAYGKVDKKAIRANLNAN